MGKPAKYNWEELKQDFILGDYKNLKEFADKNNLNYTSGTFKKATTGWQKLKKSNKQNKSKKVIEKVTEKIANKEARNIVKKIDLASDSTTKILKIINDALDDSTQFNKHMVKLRQGYGPGEFSEDIEVRQTDVIDARRLYDLMAALEKAAKLKRIIDNIIDAPEKERLQLEREKLEFEKAKANLGLDEDDETGVVVLPEIDYSLQNGGESIEQSGDTKEKDIQSQ